MLRLSGLPETLTIEQLASMTEEEMVRRRFDAGNARYVTLLTFMALATAIFQMFATYLVPLAVLHVVFAGASAATMATLVRRRRRGLPLPRAVETIGSNLTPWVVAFLIAEFAMLIALSGRRSNEWMVWAFMFPWFLIGIRLELSRRIALHAALLGVAAFQALISGSNYVQNIPPYVGAVIISGVALLAGAGASRRVRRQTIDEWSERRAQARDQLRMRDELQYAREVQLSMLPESPPEMGWVDLAGASLPATEVGGDYYDYFIEEGSVAVVCGDVAGHGLGSGIVLASLRSGFMLLRDSLHDPAAVLQRLNDLVAQSSRRRMLATAAVLRLDHASRRATIASAGHPPLIVRRGSIVSAVELFAPPLGVRLPYRVPSTEVPFASGDIFVLHSDGVYESQNAGGESYGLDRLSAVLARVGNESAAAVRDAIIRDVETFRGIAAQQDDVTVVVARVI